MKFYILASLIMFCLVIYRANKRHQRILKKEEQSFWDRERHSNNVRRKPLDNLDYITIPFDRLPVDIMPENDTVKECLDTLHILDTQKIVNFTGYTNTELKLEYGTANITALSQFDQNYTLLVITLQKWADVLYDAGLQDDAAVILEFALETKTDISKTYYTLAEIYSNRNETDNILNLIQSALSLRSYSSKTIARTLQESYPYSG